MQLRRLCQRGALGMARTGGVSSHGSGDLALAFSTAATGAAADLQVLHDRRLSPVHAAVVEATEEAILNSLTAADTMVGRDGNTIHALPLKRLVELMATHGRLG